MLIDVTSSDYSTHAIDMEPPKQRKLLAIYLLPAGTSAPIG